MGLLGFVPLVSWGSSTPSTRQFGLKFLVSGLQSMGVFVLLLAGGIMVLDGKTEIGIVVAFISGLDRVVDPWRELIAFVRSTSGAKVQFDLIEGTLGRKL